MDEQEMVKELAFRLLRDRELLTQQARVLETISKLPQSTLGLEDLVQASLEKAERETALHWPILKYKILDAPDTPTRIEILYEKFRE